MRNFEELNLNHANERVTPPPPSPQLLARFEQHFGVVLPASYLELLGFSNGGGPELGDFTADEQDYPADIDHFFHLTENEDNWNGVWRRTAFLRGVLNQNNLLAIGVDGTSDFIFLDLSDGKEDVKILFRADGNAIIQIATSFEKFIDKLFIDSELE